MQPRKYRRAAGNPLVPIDDHLSQEKIDAWAAKQPASLTQTSIEADMRAEFYPPPKIAPPPDWTLGQLINVRNVGHEYVITLLGEEADPRKPERALRVTSYLDCQNFVSRWYARTWAPEV